MLGHKCHVVLVLHACIRGRIGRILRSGNHRGSPLVEGISVFSRGILAGSGIVFRHFAIINIIQAQHGTVVILPSDDNLVCIERLVNHVPSDRSKSRFPASKLKRALIADNGNINLVNWRAVVIFYCRLQRGFIVIHKGNRVLVRDRGEGRLVGHIPRHNGLVGKGRIPTTEGVGELRIGILGGRCGHNICNGCTIIHIFNDTIFNRGLAVIHQEGDGIGIRNLRINRLVGGFTDNEPCRIPPFIFVPCPIVENIGVLGISRLGGHPGRVGHIGTCSPVLFLVRFFAVHEPNLVVLRFGKANATNIIDSESSA